MSTPGKHGNRRLGSRCDPDPEGPVQLARCVYLDVLAEIAPDVLRELRRLADDEDTTVRAWAERWRLTDAWCLAHARATRRLWRDYPGAPTCWADRDDLAGMLVPEPAPVVPRPLKMPHHFVWLARYQLGEDWSAMAPHQPVPAIDGGGVRVDVSTVRGAAIALARYIGLTMRPTRRGRRARLP